MKCFYHSADLDGKCSAAIVKNTFPACDLVPINYGQEFPWDSIAEQELIYMVDFSLPIPEMERLASLAHLVWIDHHKTAINDAGKAGFLADGLRRVGDAACQLTWEYLLDSQPGYEGKEPSSVYLLGRYDVWDLVPDTLELQQGLRLHDTNPENQALWSEILADGKAFYQALEDGEILLKKQRRDNESYAQAAAFETELDGLHLIACNRLLTNSQLFEAVWDPEKHHAMCAFGWRDGAWACSLYTDRPDVDVSVVAKARGGGGHRGAAGFGCDTLPFELR